MTRGQGDQELYLAPRTIRDIVVFTSIRKIIIDDIAQHDTAYDRSNKM